MKRVARGKRSYSRCHARLCEKAERLQALGSVADYLENGIFYMLNDSWTPSLSSAQREEKSEHGLPVWLLIRAHVLELAVNSICLRSFWVGLLLADFGFLSRQPSERKSQDMACPFGC
jgi:hypothetical protein